jgi:hypothetical protein
MTHNPIQAVLDGYRADIARRAGLIEAHRAAIAALEHANTVDNGHVSVASALIGQLDASGATLPGEDLHAAALIHDLTRGGIQSLGKDATAGLVLADRRVRVEALAALLDADADITTLDGIDAAVLIHDLDGPGEGEHAGDCPACLLLGHGDLAILDGIDAEQVAS